VCTMTIIFDGGCKKRNVQIEALHYITSTACKKIRTIELDTKTTHNGTKLPIDNRCEVLAKLHLSVITPKKFD
jgi:hypothetical protein